MSETRHKITAVAGGRSNTQTGASELDLEAGVDTVVLEMDGDTLMKTLGLAIQLQRMSAPVPGETMEFRAFPTEWWTLGHTPDQREMTLSFEIAGGGHIGFRIPADQAGRLYDTMSVTLGNMRKAAG